MTTPIRAMIAHERGDLANLAERPAALADLEGPGVALLGDRLR